MNKKTLDQQFAAFLRKQRGELSYEQFGKKVGLRKSSVFKFEQGQQSASLRTVQKVLDRLKANSDDVFEG
ncbi:MAG: helix-turn-helix domain-containing protein [Limisphaerales bacterium]